MSRRFDSVRFLIRRMLKSKEHRTQAILGALVIFLFVCGLFFMLSDLKRDSRSRDNGEDLGTVAKRYGTSRVALDGISGNSDENGGNVNKSDANHQGVILMEEGNGNDAPEKLVIGIKDHHLPFKKASLEPKLAPCPNKQIFLVIMIFSRPENGHQRRAIRTTWGANNKNVTEYMTVFVVGKAFSTHDDTVEKESAEHGDILQGGFEEIGQHSSQKMILGLAWLSGLQDVCLPKLVLKTSDNIFLNIPLILHWMEKSIKQPFDVYLGKLLRKDTPNRNRKHPNHVPEEVYPKTHFPDLIQGPLYLFSYDVVLRFLAVMRKVHRLPLEDAYIGVLAEKAEVLPKNEERFNLVKLTTNDCVNIKRLFVYDVKSNDHIVLYKQIHQSDMLRHCQGISQRRIIDL